MTRADQQATGHCPNAYGPVRHCLQADSMCLPKANRLISRQVEVFQSRKGSIAPGEKAKIALEAIAAKKFGDINLIGENTRDPQINRAQFYQALSDSMTARMLSTGDMPITDELNILFPQSWPDSTTPEYGELELRSVAQRFLVPYSGQLKADYREMKDSAGKTIPPTMRKLICAIATLPVSTAACERGFSAMNIVCSPLRNSLSTAHISSLLFVSLVGPPVHEWKPAKYVSSWLAKGRRHVYHSSGACRPEPESVKCNLRQLWAVM